ncbi:GNAT family N-acetyltransferase [Flavobacterium sp. CBA20B-1]|uniref:GNAT family N-acetyltransferase n=1 Tax=unclassified Flavobacterium TaxID=196869 RepID=UPI0022251CF1|nr:MULTISPECIES: GNAT family protein [unclassified Flavobacterium]WCM43134.1 GNAT family N-acetyltransferase [Flavobacterium sp. CBA20B-1]
MITTPEISTDRLLLKGISPQFINNLFATQTKEQIMDFLGIVDESAFNQYKKMHEKGMETHRLSHFFFLLIEKASQKTIGECGFHTWNTTHHRAEVFYALRNDTYKEKGFMSEALPKVIAYGFNEMNLHRIQALISDWNTPSLKLLQRLNFVKEGVLRQDYLFNGNYEDSHCYSLLKSEWENNT